MNEHREWLAAIPWLQSLPGPSLDWLSESVEEVSFEPGESFIVQGYTDRDCYFLISGEVEVVMNGQTMGTVGPGEVEGEMALLYRRARGATTTALETVHALVLRAADFDELASTDEGTARAIADAIIERLAKRFNMQPPPWSPPESA
jgi:CRP/FNR family transcriptional regulator, cyclic AMP receptor protein